MAAKNSTTGNIIGIVVVVGIGYFLLRWLMTPKTAQAASSPMLGGAYGGYSSPNGTAGAAQQDNSMLASILRALLGGQGGGKSGSVSSGAGGRNAAQAMQGMSPGLQNAINAIGSYSMLANNTPLTELGGASLLGYVPGTSYSDVPFSSVPTQNFNLSGMSAPDWTQNPYAFGYGSGIDTTSFGGNMGGGGADFGGIALDPTQNFDVGSMATNLGGG